MATNTREMIDSFYQSNEHSLNEAKTKGQIARKEMFEYEEKLGKSIFEMTVDELFDMVSSFSNNRTKKNDRNKISYNTFNLICGYYRKLFEWYIDNYKVIKNPFNDPRFRGSKALNRYTESVERITKADFDKAIVDLHEYYDADNADYIECVMRMYYDGFYNAECITMLKEEDINFDTNEVFIHSEDNRINGKIKISDRTLYLINKFHEKDSLPGKIQTKDLALSSYRGSYFKFIVERKNQNNIDDWPQYRINTKINQCITSKLNEPLGYNFSYRKIYLLGFYDFMVEKVGKEHADALIYTLRNTEYFEEFKALIKEYGLIFYSTAAEAKRAFKIFV